jgi:beta-1,4-mannosyl-glycoprotein beta-1,4-N-acetylglucosaminyltransferase
MADFETNINKPIKIVDCFIFYNELDLLTYRLNILNDVVDHFIIAESTHTHVGKEKPLIFNENKHLFEDFSHKIIHIIVDDFPYKYPNINIQNGDQWTNENRQRNYLKVGVEQLQLNDDDVIMITDLDEIPDPNTLLKIKNNEIRIVDIQALQMDIYNFNLNTKSTDPWLKPNILLFKKYKELASSKTFSDIRFWENCEIINNGGWHLSYFGDSNFIKNKIENFTHQEYNNDNYTNIEIIEKKMKTFENLFNGSKLIKIYIKDNNYLPPEYEKYLSKYVVE